MFWNVLKEKKRVISSLNFFFDVTFIFCQLTGKELIENMSFSNEDKVIIKHYRLEKGYGKKRLLKEISDRQWSESGLQNLLKKIDTTGSIEKSTRSGRPRSARTEENIHYVEEEILNQDDDPG